MVETINLQVLFDPKVILKEVFIKSFEQNCSGLIVGNSSGKSSFLKALAGEADTGNFRTIN